MKTLRWGVCRATAPTCQTGCRTWQPSLARLPTALPMGTTRGDWTSLQSARSGLDSALCRMLEPGPAHAAWGTLSGWPLDLPAMAVLSAIITTTVCAPLQPVTVGMQALPGELESGMGPVPAALPLTARWCVLVQYFVTEMRDDLKGEASYDLLVLQELISNMTVRHVCQKPGDFSEGREHGRDEAAQGPCAVWPEDCTRAAQTSTLQGPPPCSKGGWLQC